MSDEAKKNAPPGLSRRELLASGTGAVLLGRPSYAAAVPDVGRRHLAPGTPERDYTPVVVPDGTKLPWRIVDGVKVFHLVTGEVEHEFLPGMKARCWGYNGCVHGPVIEAVEGDRVRIYVTNRLPEATTVHWHGVLVPHGMDGFGGISQRLIDPGETFRYEFTLHQAGTFMYHPHHDEMVQMALGLTGMFVIHPRRPAVRPDRDFVLMLHEWRMDPGASRPDPMEMTEFNVLTINGRAFPGTSPLVARTDQRVRIRLGNLSAMDHHPIHLHGHQFKITETDGGPIPGSAQWPETTVLVPVGSTRTIELRATPGDWAMHCHMTHHLMNQMGHGLPNLVEIDPSRLDERVRRLLPGYMTMGHKGMGDDMEMPLPENSVAMRNAHAKHGVVTMGGMATVLKVRDGITSFGDPGWYDAPAGTTAIVAREAELRRDGIDPAAPPAAVKAG